MIKKQWVNISSAMLMAMAITGCKTMKLDDASPAIATDLNSDGKQEIAEIINKAMPGANVRLADDILSEDNRLFIDRNVTYVDGNPVQGRVIEEPRKFELYRFEGSCYLVDDKTGNQYHLKKVQCQAVN